MRKIGWLAVLIMGCCSPIYTRDIEVAPVSVPTSAAPKEIERWEQLMQVTQRNLETQKKVYQLLLTYQRLQQDPTSSQQSDALYERAQIARELQVLIEDYRLEVLFSKEFLQELKLFGQVGSKRGIPQP